MSILLASTAPLSTDGYKLFHKDAYHPSIDYVYSNFTPRFGKYANTPDADGIIHVGLQYFIIEKLLKQWDTFFLAKRSTAVGKFGAIISAYLGSKYDTTHLERLHKLGYLPLRIRSLPEGTKVPYGVACVTIENTEPGFGWLTNYIETSLSTSLWPMQTSATTAYNYLKAAKDAFKTTGGPMELLPFMIHDFSYRGMFGDEAAAMSGFSHLSVGNCGTDTLPAIPFAAEYYGASISEEGFACSVPATEHSTATSYILAIQDEKSCTKLEAEVEYVRYLFSKVPTGIVSHVSDSFDFWNFVENGLPLLKEDILNRDGTLVIRPDSGDPVDVLCGREIPVYNSVSAALMELTDKAENTFFDGCKDRDAPGPVSIEYIYRVDDKYYRLVISTEYYVSNQAYGDRKYTIGGVDINNTLCTDISAEDKGLIQCLAEQFGTTETDQGYQLLNDHIGAIYGDAITLERQQQIYQRLMAKGLVPKVVLGVGSYSYQMVTRDTHGSAVKATSVRLKSGEHLAVCKDPKTDPTKKSATGRLRIERVDGKLVQYDRQTNEESAGGLLETVFHNGYLTQKTTLNDIRKTVEWEL